MKHIEKRHPLAAFEDFVQNESPTNWEDMRCSRRYPNLLRDCRDEILIVEQGGIGGYTERPLMNSGSLHIDHYRKKGMNWPTDVTFDWNNLIVEERTSSYGACYKDKYTKDMRDYDKLFNPVEDYPENLITYQADGRMIAKNNISQEDCEKINFTIERFNLNHRSLVAEREAIIRMVFEGYGALSDDDVRSALEGNGYPTVVEWTLAARKVI